MITNILRRALALALTALLLLGFGGHIAPARADGTLVLTLGADLSEDQKQYILDFFNISEADALVITVTNADERRLLLGQYTEGQIGTKTYSCALVNPTASGGIQVKTANLSVVTSGRIASLLSTSGITDCEVLAAAPRKVSGTGALTGVMMGYEEAVGITLDPAKQQMAIEESTAVSEVGETMGQNEATLVVNDIKIRIVRGKAKKEEEITDAVDTTVDEIEAQLDQLDAMTGAPARKKLGQEGREVLYDYGRKISAMDYDYDAMKLTLQRVTVNAAREIGIDDPITETFEDLSAEDVLPANSILRTTNDESLGEEATITSTNASALEDAATLEDAVATAEHRGSLYALFDLPMTWLDARRYCRELGGDLASITTLEEQAVVEQLAAKSSLDHSWLGANYDPANDFWWWSDSSIRFTNWDDGQPDGADRGEVFMRMANRDISGSEHAGRWSTAGDGETCAFICEIPLKRESAEVSAESSAGSTARITGVRLTPYGTVEGGLRLISGTSRVLVMTDAGRRMADVDGNVLTDEDYSLIDETNGGLLAVSPVGDWYIAGVMDQDGRVVVPCVYDDISVKSDSWVIGCVFAPGGTEEDHDVTYTSEDGSDTYGVIDRADVYHVRDGQGRLLASLKREDIVYAEVKGDYINIEDRRGSRTTYDSDFNTVARDAAYGFSHVMPEEYSSYYDMDAEEHHYGVQNADGAVVLAPFADLIYAIEDGYVCFGMRAGDADLCGLASLTGEIVLPPVFDSISSFSGDSPVDEKGERTLPWQRGGYYCVLQDGVYRFAVRGGEITCDTGVEKNDYSADRSGVAFSSQDGDGRITLIAADGRSALLPEAYRSCYSLPYSMGFMWQAFSEETYYYDLLDWHGETLMSDVSDISLSGDGFWLGVRKDYYDPLEIFKVTYVYDDGTEVSAGA